MADGWMAGLTVIIMLLSPAGAWARLSLAIITLLPFPGSNRVQRKGLDKISTQKFQSQSGNEDLESSSVVLGHILFVSSSVSIQQKFWRLLQKEHFLAV